MSEILCEGWWDQEVFGRQPMHNLRLRFEGGKISGNGHDIVGPFTFSGTISLGGHVAMVKRYLGQHSVDYIGTYDGEGSLWGQWHIGPLNNRWFIKITGSAAAATHQADAEMIS